MSDEQFGTPEDYFQAFEELRRDGIPKTHLALLQAHFQATGHTATWEYLSKCVGYANFKAVSLQYGKLAGRVANLLGIHERPKGFWLYVLVNWADEKHQSGSTAFVFRRPVIEALIRLGMISETSGPPTT